MDEVFYPVTDAATDDMTQQPQVIAEEEEEEEEGKEVEKEKEEEEVVVEEEENETEVAGVSILVISNGIPHRRRLTSADQ